MDDWSFGDVALELDDLTVSFGRLLAVNAVSMSVPAGGRWAIIGPNGAGKTTLFRAMSGEEKATKGRVRFFGRDVTRLPPHRRAWLGLGRTYQVTSVFPGLTVEENTVLALIAKEPRRYHCWRPLRLKGTLASRIDHTLARVLLEGQRTRRAAELSHGEQRQLELGIALASDPDLLLLDEPAAGLSLAERQVLFQLIADLPQDLTLLVIEHDVDLAFGMADHVICMDNGAVIAAGTPEDVRSDPRVQSVYLGVN